MHKPVKTDPQRLQAFAGIGIFASELKEQEPCTKWWLIRINGFSQVFMKKKLHNEFTGWNSSIYVYL